MSKPLSRRLVVGRISQDGSRVVLLRPATAAPAPIPGPWELCAITSSSLTRRAASEPTR